MVSPMGCYRAVFCGLSKFVIKNLTGVGLQQSCKIYDCVGCSTSSVGYANFTLQVVSGTRGKV
jgi:hypothetical protein